MDSFARTMFCSLIVMLLVACGGGSSNSSDSSGNGTDTGDNTDTGADVTTECAGDTAAFLTNSSATITIPEGSLTACANASPQLSQVAEPDNVLADDETNITSGSGAFELNLKGDSGITTPTDTSASISLSFTYDNTGIDPALENSLNIYLVAQDLDSGAVVNLSGIVNPDTKSFTTEATGLPNQVRFMVVVNPDMDAVASGTDENSKVNKVNGPDALLQPNLTSSVWPTNTWCVVYNRRNATLRTVIGGLLSVQPADLTNAQIKAAVSTLVADNARASGSAYTDLGFRAPHLYLQPAGNIARACSNTNDSIYFIHLVYGDGSYFQTNSPGENIDTDTLAGFGTKFGRLFVAVNRFDDSVNSGLGTVKASVAHEMFHGIQAGYELYVSNRVNGITEGSAATIGKTLDDEGTIDSVPLVRNFSNEIFKLDYQLLDNSAGVRYANQDFFAYIARQYFAGRFDFLHQYFTNVSNKIAALEEAQRTETPYSVFYSALESTLAPLALSEVYFDFAVNRLMEHNLNSRLQRSGEITAPMTLVTSLLRSGAGRLVALSGNPDAFAKSNTSNTMAPYSTSVFEIRPDSKSDFTNGVKLTVNVTPSSGSVGQGVRVKYYRNGELVGKEAGSSFIINNWAKETNDIITVIVANAQAASGVTFIYQATTEPEESTVSNSLQLTVNIPGVTTSFTPTVISATNEAEVGGEVAVNNAIGIEAYESISLNSDIFALLLDQRQIFAPGTYSLGEVPAVFEDQSSEGSIAYQSADLTNADDGSPVAFVTSSGQITLLEYSVLSGSRLSGSFTAIISGDRVTGVDNNGNDTIESITGTLSGDFNVVIK
jgi:hypothetical protein